MEITYQKQPSNAKEILDFIGKQEPCEYCKGSGEYETEYGPTGCNPCNSRLIAFKDYTGKTVYADWGDVIIKTTNGLQLKTNKEKS